jgi:hypothetical protein
MNFIKNHDIYDGIIPNFPFMNMNNRLFCTFTLLEGIDDLISNILAQYSVMYNKMFILQIKDNNEYVVTYNIDSNNISTILENTILVHRKKDSNTLYTINALNELIKNLNNGVVDVRFPINWNHYKNTILLTQHDELKILKTKISKIINL